MSLLLSKEAKLQVKTLNGQGYFALQPGSTRCLFTVWLPCTGAFGTWQGQGWAFGLVAGAATITLKGT